MSDTLVLGLGGTVDYEIVWDSAVVESLVAAYAISAAELTTAIAIDSERDLVVSVLAFVRDGVGGERFVASSDIVEAFAGRFDTRITLGGTPVRAALAMRALGITSTIHLVSIDDHVRRLLPQGCSYICSATRDSTDPHLIVQFGQGVRIRAGDIDLRSPHPNRVILTNDPPNRELVLSDELGAALDRAEVFLISGFNCIQDAAVLDRRLATLLGHMRHLPPKAVVIYEDAGYHVPSLSLRVRDALVGLVDVYSMNEEELQSYVGRPLDLLDPREMQRALDELRRVIPAETLVVHTKYWSLALGERARANEANLRGGITMASTRYMHGDRFTEREYDEVSRLPLNPGGAEFATRIEEAMGSAVCCVPAFVVDVERPTTIGLGDTFVGGFIAAVARG
ncbi:ADP-dependent glucokinase/phosphofructokinase [Cellulomonas sp. KRMCY2]|uniref:ADP-dependent glucokinase/phosphofructokinase n=1 Tax=Cellulomonas sp. KRMCY2 TaxID=1304865 RepID=UPI00045E5CA6|nr:ADP-dependent glucokinase/phosphofructokinase [Cellulomonas sp. KRMCY2]